MSRARRSAERADLLVDVGDVALVLVLALAGALLSLVKTMADGGSAWLLEYRRGGGGGGGGRTRG